MASHWLFLVTFQIVYEFPSLSGIVGFISEWHTGWWEHFTNILKQLLRNSVVHRKYHPRLHCMYSVITEAGVQLCRFHRIQAWNRHFAQHENKDTLLQMCVAIHCNTFAYITIRVTSSKSVAWNSQSDKVYISVSVEIVARTLSIRSAVIERFYRSVPFITAWCYAYAVLAMGLCLSVTSRCSTKTAKHMITQTTPHFSPGTLVFWRQRSPRNSTGVIPYGGTKCRWGWSKSATFDK